MLFKISYHILALKITLFFASSYELIQLVIIQYNTFVGICQYVLFINYVSDLQEMKLLL